MAKEGRGKESQGALRKVSRAKEQMTNGTDDANRLRWYFVWEGQHAAVPDFSGSIRGYSIEPFSRCIGEHLMPVLPLIAGNPTP